MNAQRPTLTYTALILIPTIFKEIKRTHTAENPGQRKKNFAKAVRDTCRERAVMMKRIWIGWAGYNPDEWEVEHE